MLWIVCRSLLKNASLLVLCSDHEGFARVITESLAVGTPVVSVDCPHGPKEQLTGHLRHCLLPENNPKLIAQKVNEVLAGPKLDTQSAPILKKLSYAEVADEFICLARRLAKG